MAHQTDLDRVTSLGGDAARLRKFYDNWASDYDRAMADDVGFIGPKLVAGALAKHLPAMGPVLDVGCGTGMLAVELARHGRYPMDGMDLSPGMLAHARKRGHYRKLIEANANERFPFPDGTFLGVASSGVFTTGHVGPERLAELVRVAAPGGVIVFTVRADAYLKDGYDGQIAKTLTDHATLISDGLAPYHTREDFDCRLCILRRR
ncbi:MAG: class I SAM-dependent methyltransferase [Pseudomonadota bacterium]